MALDCPDLAELGVKTFAWNPPSLGTTAQGVLDGYPIKDFYLTNAICRASPTMQRCSAELVHGESFAEAAE
jgi:NADH-quinone oxidoreductase subunit G